MLARFFKGDSFNLADLQFALAIVLDLNGEKEVATPVLQMFATKPDDRKALEVYLRKNNKYGIIYDYVNYVYNNPVIERSKECHYKWIPEYVFQGLVYDEDFIMYAIFDNKWNETRRVPIGCLDGDEVWQLSEMRTFS